MEEHILPSVLALLLAHLEDSEIEKLGITVGDGMVVVFAEDAGLYIDLMVTNPWERAVQVAQTLPERVRFNFNVEGKQPWDYDPVPATNLTATYFAGLMGLQEVHVFDREDGAIVLAALISCLETDPSACPNLKSLQFFFPFSRGLKAGQEDEEEKIMFLDLLRLFLIIRPDINVLDRAGVRIRNGGSGM